MSEDVPDNGILIPDRQQGSSQTPAIFPARRRYSPGLLGIVERIPGVKDSATASMVLFAIAIVAAIAALAVLRGSFPVSQKTYVTPYVFPSPSP